MNKLFKGTMIKLTNQQFFFCFVFKLCDSRANTQECAEKPLAHSSQNIALILIFIGIFISRLSITDVRALLKKKKKYNY